MTQQRLVSADGAQFYVEVADVDGPATIRDDDAPLSFDGVRATVEGIVTELTVVWQRVKPAEASVEFGLKLTAKSGKLTGLVIEGGGEAALDRRAHLEAARGQARARRPARARHGLSRRGRWAARSTTRSRAGSWSGCRPPMARSRLAPVCWSRPAGR